MVAKFPGPIVRRPISAYPKVKFNPGFYFFCSKAFSRIIFSVIFKSINLLTKRIKLKLLSKLSFLNSNFAVTLGYLNPVLNNSALDDNNREFMQRRRRTSKKKVGLDWQKKKHLCTCITLFCTFFGRCCTTAT